jgi:hypothetical protein
MGRVATVQEWKANLEVIKADVGIENSKIFEKFYESYALPHFRTLRKNFTNYGEVTSNGSEQTNNSFKDIRLRPVGEGILDYISKMNTFMRSRLQSALNLQALNRKV